MLKVLKTQLNPVERLKNCRYSVSFISWKTLQNLFRYPETAGEKSICFVENMVVISTGKRCNFSYCTIQRKTRVFNTVGENYVEKCRKPWGKGLNNQQMAGENKKIGRSCNKTETSVVIIYRVALYKPVGEIVRYCHETTKGNSHDEGYDRKSGPGSSGSAQ